MNLTLIYTCPCPKKKNQGKENYNKMNAESMKFDWRPHKKVEMYFNAKLLLSE